MAYPGKLGHQAAPDPHQRLGLVRWHRHGQQVSLPEPAAHRDEQISLGLGFYAFGNHAELKRPGDPDNAFRQGQPLV